MTAVYIQTRSGKPLMPTTRCGHVRRLLKSGKARVVSTCPFTVQLLYETEEKTQPLILGIDPGRTNIGMAIVTEDAGPEMLLQAETRNKEIPKLMEKRKSFRQKHRKCRREKRQRRAKAAGTESPKREIERILPGCEKPIVCKGIKNKEARFNNRRRPAGWLTPTANHLLQTHLNLVEKVSRVIPITDVVLEVNKFAFMALDNPNIRPWEYQKGPLYRQGSVEKAVFAMQDGTCLFCGKPITRYHHVVPRSKGGSDTLENRVGLCEEHHALVHTDPEWAKKPKEQKTGMNKKYHALSVLNQIIPFLTNELAKWFPDHTYVTSGKSTFDFRNVHNIPKDHYLDAYCIACSILDKSDARVLSEKPYLVRQFRRHDRQACHQQNCKRRYMLGGKVVAVNRHRAFEQKEISLEEYLANGGRSDNLAVKRQKPTYKRQDRIMPGALFCVNGLIKTMTASTGLHNGIPDYFHFADQTKATPKRSYKLLSNTGLVFVDVLNN